METQENRKEINRQIATEIMCQISMGTKMSIGFRNPMIVENGLIFKVLSGNFTTITIRLNSSDLYDIEMHKKFTLIKKAEDVYCDVLNAILYDMTHNKDF